MSKATDEVFFRYVKATLDEERRRRRYRWAAVFLMFTSVWFAGFAVGVWMVKEVAK